MVSSFFIIIIFFFLKICTSLICLFFFWALYCLLFIYNNAYKVCYHYVPTKWTGKENIHKTPTCNKLNRCKNKWSEKVRYNKFLAKKVEEKADNLDSTSSSSKPIGWIRFPPFSQVKAAGNQALVYYGQHLVMLSLHSNTGPFCNFWVLFLISSCWEKSQSILFVKLLVTKSRSNTCCQGDLETCDLTWSPFM